MGGKRNIYKKKKKGKIIQGGKVHLKMIYWHVWNWKTNMISMYQTVPSWLS
jgi:hypothetical protein